MPEHDAEAFEGPDGPEELAGGPPWILGWRGLPLEAPENTLAGFRQALAAGLDGIHYDLRGCAGGDPVVIADPVLERTTDGSGRVADRTLTELFQLDAGGWFGRRFLGEPLPHLDEVLELGERPDRSPMHLIELRDGAVIGEVVRRLRALPPTVSVRIASSSRELCRELRDAELPAVLIAPLAGEEELQFVRDERLAGFCVANPRGWRTETAKRAWPCERWALGLMEPEDLLHACRVPLNAFATGEGRRARAIRAMVALSPQDGGDYPLRVPRLPVLPGDDDSSGGEWCGCWEPRVEVRNPFPFPVEIGCQIYVRRGAFEVEGLPVRGGLDAGEVIELPFGLKGGSWSPGGDPLFAALYQWEQGPGRPAGRVLLDAPMRRVRSVAADVITQRVEMLKESPGDREASMTLRRRRQELVGGVENGAGLGELRTVVRIDGAVWYGGKGVRVRLPEDFDDREEGVDFACGFYGRERDGTVRFRRWGGGLPDEPGVGGCGVLLARRMG